MAGVSPEFAVVTIIGAGPAGLVAALSLAQHGIKSVVLEKEEDIAQDPRGVYLAGDAVRILYSLGLGSEMPYIGHELHEVQFHRSSFNTLPFHRIDLVADSLQQSVPTGILQIQPRLEGTLRKAVAANPLCDLRLGADVQKLSQSDFGTTVSYVDSTGVRHEIESSWLIGADGKRGVVRKTFLEKVADVRQVHSDYRYEGTWVAANLKITLPTPETHPNLAVWAHDMQPEEVYDLFWPKGWHFCSPPGKATAAGRFGPHDQRMWRHEFELQDSEVEGCDHEAMFWDQLNPMITRERNYSGAVFSKPVTFPSDCIEILRCRPFTFTHKVVNKWYHHKCVLIGDAAHVFPPFGGQGIASGIRDAHQLAWRIAMLETLDHSNESMVAKVLEDWSNERAYSVRDAASITRLNGLLCNNDLYYPVQVVKMIEALMQWLFGPQAVYDPQSSGEYKGLRGCPGGFFLPDYNGGRRVPQIYLDTIQRQKTLSDEILTNAGSALQLYIFVDANKRPSFSAQSLDALFEKHRVPPSVLSATSAVYISRGECPPESVGDCGRRTIRKYSPSPLRRLSKRQARTGYDVGSFGTRLGKNVTFAIVRRDFYVFAAARGIKDLDTCLSRLQRTLCLE